MATQTVTYKRPWLYPKQEAAFFGPERFAFTEASTKSGKTVAAEAWLFEQAYMTGREGRNYWWIAPILEQARIAYNRMKAGLPNNVYQANDSRSSLRVLNGAIITFKGSDNPDSLYGEDVYAAVVDEASRCKEEAWHALRTTLTATRGPVRIIGNVKGRRNWFWRMARVAEAGEEGMTYHRITAADAVAAGVLDWEEIRQAERVLPPEVFRELYYAEASDDQGNPFGMAAIAKCVAPLSQEKPAVWGWDLAKSVDWTVGIALDSERRVCRFHRFQLPWGETKERMRQETQLLPALVDATGVGDVVVEELQRDGMSRFEGFKFSAPSKQELMFGLRSSVQQAAVKFPDGPIRLEMEAFEYENTSWGVRYGVQEGVHDDCVVALALADRHYQQKRIVPKVGVDREPVMRPRRW